MTLFVTIAYLVAAGIMFWHSAESPDRRPLHRAMLYAFAFAAMCFGAARFLTLFGAVQADWQWMVDLGHLALIAFGIMWVARETGRMAMLKGKLP